MDSHYISTLLPDVRTITLKLVVRKGLLIYQNGIELDSLEVKVDVDLISEMIEK